MFSRVLDWLKAQKKIDLKALLAEHASSNDDPAASQTAKADTKFLYQGYILIFGDLAMLLSDKGANFISSIIDEMYKLLSVRKL